MVGLLALARRYGRLNHYWGNCRRRARRNWDRRRPRNGWRGAAGRCRNRAISRVDPRLIRYFEHRLHRDCHRARPPVDGGALRANGRRLQARRQRTRRCSRPQRCRSHRTRAAIRPKAADRPSRNGGRSADQTCRTASGANPTGAYWERNRDRGRRRYARGRRLRRHCTRRRSYRRRGALIAQASRRPASGRATGVPRPLSGRPSKSQGKWRRR
jgi:hypothetical protein